jgi:hypothetical protein
VPGALVKAGETNGPGLGQGSSMKQPRRDELGWPGDARDATRKDQKFLKRSSCMLQVSWRTMDNDIRIKKSMVLRPAMD